MKITKIGRKIILVPAGTPQPLWSVMIKNYNCTNYLRKTLASVLALDSRLEVVDRYSTKDSSEVVVKDIAGDRTAISLSYQN